MLAIDGAPIVDGVSERLRKAFSDQARRGVLLTIGLRAALTILALVVALTITLPAQQSRPFFYRIPPQILLLSIASVTVLFACYLAAARSNNPVIWCFIALGFEILITSELKFFWIWPLFNDKILPSFVIVRYQDVLDVVILVAIYSLPLSRPLLMSAGVLSAAMWVIGIMYGFMRFPSAHLYVGALGPGATNERLQLIADPAALMPDYLAAQGLLILAFAVFLTMATRASRSHIINAVNAEDRIGRLSRFMPPKLAAEFMRPDAEGLVPNRRTATILFISAPDTSEAEDRFRGLERFYARAEAAIFAMDGVIDRYFGGPVMATFGAIGARRPCADEALACARSLSATLGPGVHLALHTGTVVCGEIGGEGTRSFSVVGDAVHVARRILEEAERRSAPLLLSNTTAEAVDAPVRAELRDAGSFVPRGRENAVALSVLAP